MSTAPQFSPAHSPTTAAGPQPAQDVPGVGVGIARPAALYVRIAGVEHLVTRLDLRVPRANEHEVADFVLVPTVTERDLFYEVAREINDALVYGSAL